MRDRLVVLEPFIGFGDSLALGIAQSVSIFLGRDHGFEHMKHGSELAGAELVEQAMGMLYIGGHCVLPGRLLPCQYTPCLLYTSALQYLRKALEEGLKERKQLEKDPEFASMRDTKEFKDLLALEPRVL